MPGAEPIFWRGDATGCLLLHGFTASPSEVSWLAAHLAAEGRTVYAPRLAGHGTHPHDLARTTWADWYASALDGYHLLQQCCQRVVVIGHSMGGMLALVLASQQALAGVGVLASPVLFPKTMALAKWLKWLRPYTDQSDKSPVLNDYIKAEQARRGLPVRGRTRYDEWSTAAVAELVALANVTQAALPSVTAPLLLVYSEADNVVGLENRDLVGRAVGSTQVTSHTLKHSNHILLQDAHHAEVFPLVSAFVGGIT
jgi:carboxylesterase